MAVSVGAKPARAKATPVSRERFVMPAGYGGAWPDTEPTRRATHQRPGATGVEGAGGSGGHGRASRSTTPSRRLACGDLAGGRALRRPEHQRSRKQQAQSRIPAAPPVWRAQEGPAAAPVGGRAWLQRPWVAGPGRGAGGWRQGQGGPRDRPLRAQLACGDLAGGPPPTGTHSGRAPQSSPAPQTGPPAPGTPAAPRCGDGGNRTPVSTLQPQIRRCHKQRKNAARHSNCAA